MYVIRTTTYDPQTDKELTQRLGSYATQRAAADALVAEATAHIRSGRYLRLYADQGPVTVKLEASRDHARLEVEYNHVVFLEAESEPAEGLPRVAVLSRSERAGVPA